MFSLSLCLSYSFMPVEYSWSPKPFQDWWFSWWSLKGHFFFIPKKSSNVKEWIMGVCPSSPQQRKWPWLEDFPVRQRWSKELPLKGKKGKGITIINKIKSTIFLKFSTYKVKITKYKFFLYLFSFLFLTIILYFYLHFIEAWVTYKKLNLFNVYKLMNVEISNVWNHHHNQWHKCIYHLQKYDFWRFK